VGDLDLPEKARGSYLLPVKAEVRRAEGLEDGRRVRVTLVLLGAEAAGGA